MGRVGGAGGPETGIGVRRGVAAGTHPPNAAAALLPPSAPSLYSAPSAAPRTHRRGPRRTSSVPVMRALITSPGIRFLLRPMVDDCAIGAVRVCVCLLSVRACALHRRKSARGRARKRQRESREGRARACTRQSCIEGRRLRHRK